MNWGELLGAAGLLLVALGSFMAGQAVGASESGYWMERAVSCWSSK